jgi:hypothetical protein
MMVGILNIAFSVKGLPDIIIKDEKFGLIRFLDISINN